MAKKQVFGSDALRAKASARKMAKVVVATKNEKGNFAYREVMIDQDNVQEFLNNKKS